MEIFELHDDSNYKIQLYIRLYQSPQTNYFFTVLFLFAGEDEKSIIRTMLALEQARIDFVDGNMKIIQQQQPSTLLNYEIVDSRLMEEDPLRSQLSVTTTTTISNVLPTTTTTQTLLVSSNSTKIEEKSIPSKSDAISMVQGMI